MSRTRTARSSRSTTTSGRSMRPASTSSRSCRRAASSRSSFTSTTCRRASEQRTSHCSNRARPASASRCSQSVGVRCFSATCLSTIQASQVQDSPCTPLPSRSPPMLPHVSVRASVHAIVRVRRPRVSVKLKSSSSVVVRIVRLGFAALCSGCGYCLPVCLSACRR